MKLTSCSIDSNVQDDDVVQLLSKYAFNTYQFYKIFAREKRRIKKRGGKKERESGKRRRLMTVLSDKEVRKRKHGEKERGLWFHGLWWVCVLFLKN